tara:strand:- start:1009 stop:1299 length:291 start_codon:yes stop_codon:yes gene_type:complete
MYPEPNITRPYELLTHVNTNLTDGMFGTIILVGIFLVAMLSILSKTGDLPKAYASSAFISLILCILLWSIGIIAPPVLMIFLALALGGIVAVWIKS